MFYYTNPSNITACDGFALANTSSNYPLISYNWVNSSGSSVSTSNIATNLCNDAYIYTAIASAGCTYIDPLLLALAMVVIDNSMWNYNPMSNADDGSCIPFLFTDVLILQCSIIMLLQILKTAVVFLIFMVVLIVLHIIMILPQILIITLVNTVIYQFHYFLIIILHPLCDGWAFVM